MRWNSTVRFPVEVQFEDIDGGGVVHHPNYLKYLERARCQAMREIGVPFGECLQEGIAFVVAEIHAKYLQPLSLAAECVVETRLVAARKSSLKILQKIVSPERPAEMSGSESDFLKTDKKTYFIAQLRLVAVDLKSGKAISLPEKLRLAGGLPQIEVLAKDPVLSDVRLAPFSEG
jgi:YbgC/YbaW family acyl-CoA thioester hydrolase